MTNNGDISPSSKPQSAIANRKLENRSGFGRKPPSEEWNGAALCRGAATPAKTALANFPPTGYFLAMNRKLVAVTLIALAWSSLVFGGEIHDAAKSGDLEKVKALLKANPDLVFSKDTNGCTPLHLTVQYVHKDMTEFLLTNKADVNAKDIYGWTPLHMAARFGGHKEMVELLLTNKADVNAKDKYFGRTPLHLAAAEGYKDVVELLLANKADVNIRINDGETSLHFAAVHAHKDVAELLLANKADVNAMANDGSTPLDQMKKPIKLKISNDSKDDSKAVAELLRQHGGREFVHEIDDAARDGDLEKVKTLLKSDPGLIFSEGDDGGTPLHYAAYGGHKDVTELLLATKADVNAGNYRAMTPLHVATVHAHKDVADLLRQHGGHE